MNVYLDIDGVLLANDLNAANYVHEFLETVNNKADKVYWLTTHCQGDPEIPRRRLSLVFEPKTMTLIQNYLPTSWETAKTRAINFNEPFLWFDDDLFYEEKTNLEAHGLLDNWIEVDLSSNPDQLMNFVISFPVPINSIDTSNYKRS
jgi:hypothetical protein